MSSTIYGENKKKLNSVEVDDFTHKWLINEANEVGMRLGDYAGMRLEEIAKDDVKSKEGLGYEWFRQRAIRDVRLKHAVAMYLQDPNDEGMEKLKVMCSEAGKSYEEIVAEIEADPFSSLIAQGQALTLKTRCVEWLPRFIMEHGGSVYSAIIEAAAAQEGFSKSTVERAKRMINIDRNSPTIIAVKDGTRWSWQIEE